MTRFMTFEFGVVVWLAMGVLPATQADRQASPPLPKPGPVQPAEQVYKNIQVLKGVPSDQIIPTMQFITSSLGVDCAFCHVENHFDRDDKKPKETARKMIRMEMAVNQNHFDNHLKVTCNTCHRATRTPISIPVISDASGSPPLIPASEELPRNLPSADELIARYVQALGGTEAIQRISTLAEKGTVEIAGRAFPIDVTDKAPASRQVTIHFPEGDSLTTVAGQEGWLAAPRRPVRSMPSAEVEDARMDADLQFPLHINQYFGDLRPAVPEKIGARSVDQLVAQVDGLPRARLYFDKDSGLLVRLVRYSKSPLGLNPTRVDYDDYQPMEGVKVPRRVEIARPSGRFVFQITEAKPNVTIDDRIFAKPSGSKASQ